MIDHETNVKEDCLQTSQIFGQTAVVVNFTDQCHFNSSGSLRDVTMHGQLKLYAMLDDDDGMWIKR